MTVALPLAMGGYRGTGTRPIGGLSTIMESERPSLGEWVRRYRKLRGLTQKQLGDGAQTGKDTINEIEGDIRIPGHEILVRIIKVLQAPAAPFLRSIGYPIEDGVTDWEASLTVAFTEDEPRNVAITVVRAMMKQANGGG